MTDCRSFSAADNDNDNGDGGVRVWLVVLGWRRVHGGCGEGGVCRDLIWKRMKSVTHAAMR